MKLCEASCGLGVYILLFHKQKVVAEVLLTEQEAQPSTVNISCLLLIIKKAADLGKKTEGKWKQRLK